MQGILCWPTMVFKNNLSFTSTSYLVEIFVAVAIGLNVNSSINNELENLTQAMRIVNSDLKMA